MKFKIKKPDDYGLNKTQDKINKQICKIQGQQKNWHTTHASMQILKTILKDLEHGQWIIANSGDMFTCTIAPLPWLEAGYEDIVGWTGETLAEAILGLYIQLKKKKKGKK